MQRTSFRLSAGSITREMPRSMAEITIGSAPRTGRTAPSNPSSPKAQVSARLRASSTPMQHSVPSAMGRSKAGPSFFKSAGARLTVSRAVGKP